MFNSEFPAPLPNDPDYVYENAAFLALGHPPSRRILELLRVQPRTAFELSPHVSGHIHATDRWLRDLEATGFVSSTVVAKSKVYRLEGNAMERVRAWLAGFD